MRHQNGKISKCYLGLVKGLYGDFTENQYKPTSRGKIVKRRRNLEHLAQVKLVSWIKKQGWVVIKINNEGKKSRILGYMDKQAGLYPGASDLLLCEVTQNYAGFFMEMKKPGDKPKAHQVEFLELMRKKGYHADWFDDWEKAKMAVQNYMEGSLLWS